MNTKQSYSEKLKLPQWQLKRAEILSRDNCTCTLCGDSETLTNVHHKSYSGKFPWETPSDQLTTLCKHCHEVTHIMGDDPLMAVIKVKKTQDQLRMIVFTKKGVDFFDIIIDTPVRLFGLSKRSVEIMHLKLEKFNKK